MSNAGGFTMKNTTQNYCVHHGCSLFLVLRVLINIFALWTFFTAFRQNQVQKRRLYLTS